MTLVPRAICPVEAIWKNLSLSNLPFAIGLSRATNQIIRQNLWISLGMVALLVPAPLLGLSIGPAVVLHEGSTIVVVLNALRLLAFKKR